MEREDTRLEVAEAEAAKAEAAASGCSMLRLLKSRLLARRVSSDDSRFLV